MRPTVIAAERHWRQWANKKACKLSIQVLPMYDPGRNYYKIVPLNTLSSNNLSKYYNIDSIKDFICHVAATGVSPFARELARDSAF